jgi:UDP-glucuronate 4-epimerase
MEQRRILVTGAAGFIGAEVTKALGNLDFDVQGIDSYSGYYSRDMKESHVQNLGIKSKIQNIDICNLSLLENFFEKNRPEIVVHLAAQGGVRASRVSPSPYIDSNQNGFLNVLGLSERFGVEKFLYASSSSVYGDQLSGPFKEDMQLNAPKSLYALSKLSNEIIAREYPQTDMKRIGLRFFTVYGPWGRPDMAVFRIIASSLLNIPFQLTAQPTVLRDFTFVQDLVEAVVGFVIHNHLPPNEIFNVAGGNPDSLQNLISYLDKKGMGLDIVQNPSDPFDVNLTYGSIEKLERFGIKVPSTKLYSGLDSTLDWMTGIPLKLLREWYEYSR